MSLQLAGDLERAAQLYRGVLEAEPQHAAANYCMGMLLLQGNRASESLPNLLAALAAEPQIPDYWLGYLEALVASGHLAEAKTTLALAQQHGLSGQAADSFAARLNVKLSTLDRAARRREVRAADKMEAQLVTHVKERDFAAAQAAARRLTQRFPGRGLGWKILGALLAADGHPDEALPAMREATRLMPQDAEALCNLGVTLSKLDRCEEAEECLKKAITRDPAFDDSYLHLGFVYATREKFPEAETMFRRAVADSVPADNAQNDMRHSSLLFLLSHNSDLSAAELFAEHLAIGRWLEGSAGPARPNFPNQRLPERRLNVGFVSGDFRTHALANFFEPIVEKLRDHEGLRLHAYSNYEHEDDTTRRMRGCFAEWHSVSKLLDRELAALIKDDGIDILVDLSSHTSFNRLRVFALKPAPLQVSWMGYPGTTGLRAMDYYLADRHFLPPGQFDDSFTEKIVHLPAAPSLQPYAGSPPVNRLPALDAGFVTFGSFNRVGKLTPFAIRLWCRLLRELPNSIMILAAVPLDERRHKLAAMFGEGGIVEERLAFFPRSDMPTYLALHNQVDICLDTYPYTGGTTTNHALWMGVPTLTLAGPTPASRQGAANLLPLGLDAFIAADEDDFVRKGLDWSNNLGALAEVRSGLRERCAATPLRRPETIADAVDAALRHMWRRWCEHLPARSFSIDPSGPA